mmetsp:Transcript_33473/g.88130  ORF Transcript_33473/g.88130 Transcript_33473/m.88130 type:complete len:294 (+) Transcript_33473:1-882(+)
MDTRSAASMSHAIERWLAMGVARPWKSREARAFFVGDKKAFRPHVIAAGRLRPDLLAVHEAVSTNRTARLPFEAHAAYKATVYAHGFHFNSVRWRRLSLLGGTVVAQEAPCKEWWQFLAHPWVHYAPVDAHFGDLTEVVARLLDPRADAAARAMAAAQHQLALRAFRPSGLLDYIEALWIAYARLQRRGAASTTSTVGQPIGKRAQAQSIPHTHPTVRPPSRKSAHHRTLASQQAAAARMAFAKRLGTRRPPPQPHTATHETSTHAASARRPPSSLRHVRPSWSVEHAFSHHL